MATQTHRIILPMAAPQMTSLSQGGGREFNSRLAHLYGHNMTKRREEIIRILEDEEKSAQDLANSYETTLQDILEDLEHIRLSIKPRQLRMDPPLCRKCGFIFKERSRVKSPSRCPRCKSEWIQAPLFKITTKWLAASVNRKRPKSLLFMLEDECLSIIAFFIS